MKKLIAVLLCIVMVLSMAACGKDKEEDTPAEDEEILTKYTCVYIEKDGSSYRAEDALSDETYIRLREEKEGKMVIDGKSFSIKWKLKDNDLTIMTEDDDYEGELDEGVLTIKIDGVKYTMASKGTKVREPKNLVEGGMGPVVTEPVIIPTAPVESSIMTGAYDLLYCVFDDTAYLASDLELYYSISIYDGGNCYLDLGENSTSGSWREVDGNLMINDTYDEYLAEYDNGIITLASEGLSMIFALPNVHVPEPDNLFSFESYTEPKANYDYTGDWYGWWIVDNCTGDLEGFDNSWWDCCATITSDGYGNGHLIFWDEDYSKNDPIIETDVYFSGDYMISGSGNFWDMVFGDEGFVVDPTDSRTEGIEKMIAISGSYNDGETTFDYIIYMRPWGMLWDDLDEDVRTGKYEWYQSMIASGSAMPSELPQS